MGSRGTAFVGEKRRPELYCTGPDKSSVFFLTEPSNKLWQASVPEIPAVSRKAQQLAENLGSLPQQRVSAWGRFFQHAAEVSGKRPVFSEDCRN